MVGLFSCAMVAAAISLPHPFEVVGSGTNSVRKEVRRFNVPAGSVQLVEGRIRYSGKGGSAQIGTGTSVHSIRLKDGNGMDFRRISRVGAKGVFRLEVGHWHANGTVRFEDIRLRELKPVYARFGGLALGYGERIDGNRYGFGYTVFGKNSNDARPLVELHKTLSQNGTITLFRGGHAVFRHELDGRRFLSATVSVNAAYMIADSRARIEVSSDAKSWRTVGTVGSNGPCRVPVPADMLPCAQVHLRVSAEGNSCAFASIALDAEIDGAPVFAFGSTEYRDSATGEVCAGAEPWGYLGEVTGELLPGNSDLALWRELPERKVFKGRPLPGKTARSIEFSAARNESEARQLVVRPKCDIDGLEVSAEVDGLDVSVKRVGYVFVDALSDSMGARGWWPDPLFPQSAGGCSVRKGENQPFWIKVRVPKNAARGVRRGFAKIMYRDAKSRRKRTVRIPLSVRVFGFSLPDVPACESAFGLDWHRIFRYHRVSNRTDRVEVAKLYHELFGEHRISPYNVLPLGISYGGGPRWHDRHDLGKVRVDFDWGLNDAEMERLFRTYGFSSFKTWIHGLGGGDLTGPKKRSIVGYRPGKGPYERLVKSYARQLQDHYAQKGWLHKAYVYMYDEPLEKHYPYVMESARILREGAPKLRRMVTVGPKEELLGGPNLWCPITYSHDPEDEAWKKARAAGDQFWWYVTYSSREPLVNEHIEHSGIDSRLWLWQTWGENYSGILMWETACWKGNPYGDLAFRNANGIVRSSAEGLYIYPPAECFGTEGKILAPPVDSIRFDLLREGIEDYDYFALLKKRSPSSPLLKVPENVYRTLREYSTDPSHIHSHRNAIAGQLDSL